LRRITVTVPITVDAAAFLGKHLEADDGDGDVSAVATPDREITW
jgi:hypothetical protein